MVKNPSEEDDRKKKGSLGGAIALVIGTSIGTGLLALPQKASPAVHTSFFSLLQLCLNYRTTIICAKRFQDSEIYIL